MIWRTRQKKKEKSLSKDLEQECLLFVLSVCKQYPYLAVIEMTSWISQPESYHTLYFSLSCAVSQISFLILRGFEVSGKHVRSSFAHDPCSVFMSLTRFICVPVQEISEWRPCLFPKLCSCVDSQFINCQLLIALWFKIVELSLEKSVSGCYLSGFACIYYMQL